MKIKLKKTPLKGCYLLKTAYYKDNRGIFSRIYDQSFFKNKILNYKWVQQNISINPKQFTFRGLHFQKNKFQETKFISILNGKIIDYAFDLRKHSKSYGKLFSFNLSLDEYHSVIIPKGVAHGFYTLTKNTFLVYSSDAEYNKTYESGISILDEYFKRQIPNFKKIIISKKDREFDNFNKSIDYLK